MLADRHPAGEGPWHSHHSHQLIHASEGVVSVHTEDGLWVVPPQRAVWVGSDLRHRVASRTGFYLHTLYVKPPSSQVPRSTCVVAVDPLVNELLIAASVFRDRYQAGGAEERLIQVILDRLPLLAIGPLHLRQPGDPAARRIATALAKDPADPRTLGELASEAGLTERTAARLFVRETGLTFGQWRQQMRLIIALERLGAGESVTRVALEVGYRDVSAFITLFKSAFGETPARYFRKPLSE